MVARAGAGWRLAPSLGVLVDELDRLWPDRDRGSDGSIGDLAHQSRTSDHNPYLGWVHAVDLDEDLAPGVDLRDLVAELVESRDSRIRYLIYERQIIKSYWDPAGRPPWVWQPYTGANAHTHHLHVSIERRPSAREDLRPWWPAQEVDDMFSDDDRELLRTVADFVAAEAPAGYTTEAGRTVSWTYRRVKESLLLLRQLAKQAPVDVDEAEIARLVLEGLDPSTIAMAIPSTIASDVAEELAHRLSG